VTISPIGLNAAAPATGASATLTQNSATSAAGVSATATQVGSRVGAEQVAVKFAPSSGAASPFQQVGSTVVSKLKDFEASRAGRNAAMTKMNAGPATAIETAKSQLLDGPASRSLTSGASQSVSGGGKADDAMTAMTRTFDYAIETQLIVKTGSQLSTSASSLMRGQ